MTIGLLIISSEWGGAEETVYFIAKYLRATSADIILYTNTELLDRYSDIEGLKIYSLGHYLNKNKFLNLISYMKIRIKLKRLLKIHKPDILHTHLEGSLFVLFSFLRPVHSKIIFTLHGAEINNYYLKKSLLVYFLLKNMFLNAKKITTPSGWQIQDLEKVYKSKAVVLPNGVESTFFKPLSVKKASNSVLFVGRYIEAKGIRELLSVARELPQYTFWFAGWGKLSVLINTTNTKNLGQKSRKELVKLYNKATVCVFPSYSESFGIVGLEAMACGTPIIATRKGFSEFLENGKEGFVIDDHNRKQLKQAIITMMENPQLRLRFGENAKTKSKKYEWIKIIKRYSQLYYNVVKGEETSPL